MWDVGVVGDDTDAPRSAIDLPIDAHKELLNKAANVGASD